MRSAEALIRREPLLTAGVGLLGLFVPIVFLVLLTVTVIGAPLAFGIAFGLWPLAAFIGYLVAGIAIGDWIVGRLSPGVTRERPYLAAVVGLVVLEVVGILPLVSAIATLFGYGAVLLLAWRTLRSEPAGISDGPPRPSAGRRAPADAAPSVRRSIMKILVTAASRHGSTKEIATLIAGLMEDAGLEADVREPDDDHVARRL